MSGRASLATRAAATRRWPVAAIGAFIAGVGLASAVVVAPFAFSSTSLQTEIAAQVHATTGLAFATSGAVRFDLLPRPHVVASGVHIRDPSQTLAVDAAKIEGDVRLLPLLVGRVELTAVTLMQPHLTINLDGLPMRTDSTIGRALHAGTEPDAEKPIGSVTLVDGTATLESKAMADAPVFSAVDVTIDWPTLDSPATLTGSIEIGARAQAKPGDGGPATIPADLAAWIAEPSSLMRGAHSAATLSIHSVPLDLSANGDLAIADVSSFHGHLSAQAPSILTLLRLAGLRLAAPARFADLNLTSDATMTIDRDGHRSVDLPNLHLQVDDNSYEGTLALQSGARPLVSGTLACDQLNLAPFLHAMPTFVDAAHQWTRTPIEVSTRPIDLDLRISASHLRVAALSIDDAALAVMTRDERTEVGLIDGSAYGGTIKGRMSFGVGAAGLNVRGGLSLEDVDAATLSWDAVGRQLAAGTLSATATIETTGDTPAALINGLGGWVKVDAHGGELSTVDLGQALHADGARGASVAASLMHGRTPFDRFLLGLRLADGIATVEQGAMRGPDADLAVAGTVDLAARRVDLGAIATLPSSASGDATASTAPAPARRQAVSVTGSFDHIDVAAAATPVR